jgi:hypothetical protein
MGIWMDNTIVCISGKNLNINQLIRECLPYVFAMENFGLRQSKGFGCFTVGDEFPELITKFGKSIGVEGIYKSIFTEDWKIGLQRISKIWKLLKAGDTHNNPYYKSDLMKYLCLKDGTRWEKRKIKAEIYNNYPKVWEQLKHETINNRISGCHSDNDKAEEIKIAKEQYKYHRGLLGLAQNYEFQTNNRFRDSAMVEIDGDEIERFRSPVTFKIYNETIYMFCHPIPVNLWKSDDGNRIYSFKLKSNIANEPFSGTLAELEIPENFHVCDFLESKWVGENFENIKINWGNPNAPSVAKHHKFEKIQ